MVSLRPILTEKLLSIDVSCLAVELSKVITHQIVLSPFSAEPPKVHIFLAGK